MNKGLEIFVKFNEQGKGIWYFNTFVNIGNEWKKGKFLTININSILTQS